MRIISGQFKGRRLNPPMKNWPTRPTTDFAREALFNVLENLIVFNEISMLDLFGGTGVHSIEAVSRGCKNVIFVDRFVKANHYLKSILQDWEIENAIKCVKSDCKSFIRKTNLSFDYIFADPPYDQKEWIELPDLIREYKLLNENGFLVIEHDMHLDYSNCPGFDQQRSYGQSRFSFFRYQS